MREVIADIERWRGVGKEIAVATVVHTWGSAPRGVGAKMALTADAEISGSVSGGCVEAAVVEAGTQVIQTGRPQLLRFGVADEDAWKVGLACGGQIEVFVKRLEDDPYQALHRALEEESPVATVTVVRGPAESIGREIVVTETGEVLGELSEDLKARAIQETRAALSAGQPRRARLNPSRSGQQEPEPTELFIDVHLPPPTLILVGGVHIAIALASLARTVGYRTIVVDPREVFGSKERFSHVDRLVEQWPDEALRQIGLNRFTAVATLTHDPKLDDPALRVALQSPAFYVGALGSRQTQAKRRQRLLAQGLSEEHLSRLRAPIGLDIGSKSPEEIALSIMAQVVSARNRMLGAAGEHPA